MFGQRGLQGSKTLVSLELTCTTRCSLLNMVSSKVVEATNTHTKRRLHSRTCSMARNVHLLAGVVFFLSVCHVFVNDAIKWIKKEDTQKAFVNIILD